MKCRARGLTLLELVATLAVAAILAVSAVPGLTRLLEGMKGTTVSHGLTASLMSARMAAVTRGHPVAVCPSADGARCDAAGKWGNGWIVFADPKRTGQPQDMAAVLHRVDAAPSGVGVAGSVGREAVRYQPDGRASGTNMTFRVCSRARAQLLVSVIVSNAGRTRSERPSRPTACVF